MRDDPYHLTAENGRLRSLADSLGEDNQRNIQKLAEAAAFLDRMASRLERAAPDGQLNMAAADCRAMAAKLRGDNG